MIIIRNGHNQLASFINQQGCSSDTFSIIYGSFIFKTSIFCTNRNTKRSVYLYSAYAAHYVYFIFCTDRLSCGKIRNYYSQLRKDSQTDKRSMAGQTIHGRKKNRSRKNETKMNKQPIVHRFYPFACCAWRQDWSYPGSRRGRSYHDPKKTQLQLHVHYSQRIT